MATTKTIKTVPQVVRARYHKVEIPEHQGNPLIEALPAVGDATDLISTFGHFPEMRGDLSKWGRLQMIDLLDQNYLEPLTNHFEVIQQLFLSIPSGYTFRNLASSKYRKALVKFYQNASKGELKPLYPWQPTSHPGFSFFGCSGVGKSTVIERALTYFPKAIYHPRYKTTQVVWIKVDCPPDGSMKQFLLSVIREFDSVLGSSYLDQYGALATDGLILAVAFLSAYHHLGMLVIDEVQHLLDARQNNDAVLLNYLVTLNNVIHIPIVYVGTIRAMDLCELAFRQARRVGTPFVWDRLHKNSRLWGQFMESLWNYQWCEPVELSEQISEAMYFHTQGIHALVVRLFQLAQKEALLNNKKISPEVIKQVAQKKFVLVQPMLESLRQSTGDPRKFWSQKEAKKYEDLIYMTLTEPREVMPPSAPPQVAPSCEPEINLTFSALERMGYDKASYKHEVLKMFHMNPLLNADKAVNQFLLSIESPQVKEDFSHRRSLEQIAEQAKASRETPLQGLQTAGLSPKTRKNS